MAITTKESWARQNILQMSGYVPGEQPQGGKFIKLNTNENPYRCSDAVVKAITDAANQGLQKYPDPTGFVFRSAFGQKFDIDPSWILCGNGSDEILSMLFTTFVDKGEKVRWPWPTYVLYKTLADIQAADVSVVPFENDWTLGDAFVANADNIALVFVANPNSPSGTMLSIDQLRPVAEAFNCPVVIDEAYVDFSREPLGALELVKQYKNVVVTRTLSKSYALAGLRFGWMVANPEIIDHVNKVRDSYNCDALSIAGATSAILDDNWQKSNKEKIVATRSTMETHLSNLGFDVTHSSANFVWCKHPDISSDVICRHLKSNQILVRYMSFEEFGDGIRITVGTDDQLSALYSVLQKLIETN